MNESEAKKILDTAIEREDGLYTNLDGAVAWNTDDEKITMEGENSLQNTSKLSLGGLEIKNARLNL